MIAFDAFDLASENAVLRAELEQSAHRNDRLHETLTWALRDATAATVRDEVDRRLADDGLRLADLAEAPPEPWLSSFDGADAEFTLTLTGGQWAEVLHALRGRRGHLARLVERNTPALRRARDGNPWLWSIEALKRTLATESIVADALPALTGTLQQARQGEHAQRVLDQVERAWQAEAEERAADAGAPAGASAQAVLSAKRQRRDARKRPKERRERQKQRTGRPTASEPSALEQLAEWYARKARR